MAIANKLKKDTVHYFYILTSVETANIFDRAQQYCIIMYTYKYTYLIYLFIFSCSHIQAHL